MHVFWFVHSIAIKRPKLAWRFLMCSQGCEIKTETWVTVFNVFTTLWKKDPSLHHRFWRVHNMINRKLHDGFWCVRDILDGNLDHSFLCVENIVKKRPNLVSRFFMCWEHFERRSKFSSHILDWLTISWKKPKLASSFFICSQHWGKKTAKLASWIWMCSKLSEKRPITCIRLFNVLTTFWKKTQICFTIFEVFATLWKKGETCVTVFGVFTTFRKKT